MLGPCFIVRSAPGYQTTFVAMASIVNLGTGGVPYVK